MNDTDYMRLALQLAERGAGWTSPNPMVGAVIVKNGRIIGQGWHARYGELHAERAALRSCTEDPAGGTMYVTLEPCCHHGKQPPCTDAVLEAGITRVVVGSADPNPLVAGRGIELLRTHGIEVTEGVLRAECDALNRIFMHYITTGRPFVSMKYAMTMDGKIATYKGAARWVTGEAARQHVQTQRHRFRGIMIGVGTVLSDDPQLTCRIDGGRNPIRIICDTQLRTPLSAQVVTSAQEVTTILATCCDDPERHAPYLAAGCRVLCVPETARTRSNVEQTSGSRMDPHPGSTGADHATDAGAVHAGHTSLSSAEADHHPHLDLTALMSMLGAEGIDSILLEGGGTLNWAALECGIVQQVQCYIAPKLFGGETAKTPVEGLGVPTPDACFRLTNRRFTELGDDILIESEVVYPCLPESSKKSD